MDVPVLSIVSNDDEDEDNEKDESDRLGDHKVEDSSSSSDKCGSDGTKA
jgi:hypothetical protein